ncbi:MAG TPA: hypothetical protein VEJ36_03825, partial [Nitrososphaerales archaeon]|nr:hypothetical protein [Nitrososphaerales archaeon]
MSARNPLRVVGLRRDDSIRPKVASTIKEIELHRRELENLRVKLDQRRKGLYDVTMKAMNAKDQSKAMVYANEWAELKKVVKVVYASELALTQVVLRLESIVDVGEVMMHMSMAFKVLRSVNRTVQGLVPSLDQASADINSALSETMSEMGNVSPSISLDIKTDSGEELVEQARKLAEERAEEMRATLGVSPKALESGAEEFGARIPVLATGEEDEDEARILGVLYGPPKPAEPEEALRFATLREG